MAELKPRIVGTGYCVPKSIRKNDAPIFNWIKKHPEKGAPDLFKGYKERRVLKGGENLMTIMLPAAQMALKNAGKKAADVDILLGTASISQYINPNQLSELHKELGLPSNAWAVPIANDYSNFNSCLLIADGLLRAGHVKTVLICIGGNWTRNVHYHTPQAVSAGDGAGAAVMTMSNDKSKWSVVDTCTISDTQYYGGMFTDGAELKFNPPYQGYAKLYSDHFFQINKKGKEGFIKFGVNAAANSVLQLLKSSKVKSADITLMPNQSSSTLIDPWLKVIKPGQNIDTITTFANMTVATHIVNLAYAEKNKLIKKDNLILMALGPDMHANAILLKRG
jgi:3-oxoacyl-[acyl-carrier-protein] synthase-3